MEKNDLTVSVATAVGLGAIIGAGIFTLSGTAIALAGTWSLFGFILVGIVAIIVSFEFGELCSIFPNANGASYSYIYEAFGSELGFVAGILLYFSFASSISVVALGFASYLERLLSLPINSYDKTFAIVLIVVLSIVNLIGVRKAAKADSILVAIKVAVLLLFVCFAFFFAAKGSSLSNIVFQTSPKHNVGAIFDASIAIFFAYSGFQTISTFASKVRGGTKAAAKAIVLSVTISIVIYLLVAFALLILIPVNEYSINADPLAFALAAIDAPSYLLSIVSVGALVATVSASLALILSSSRIMYQISRDGLLPKAAGVYDEKRDVARNGIFVSALIAIAMLYFGDVYLIAAMSNFGLLCSYLMASFALIHFRRLGIRGSYSTPLYPYLPIACIIGILAFMFGMPRQVLVTGMILLLILIIVYYSLVEYEERKPVKIKLFK